MNATRDLIIKFMSSKGVTSYLANRIIFHYVRKLGFGMFYM